MNLEQMKEHLNESWNKSLMQMGGALLVVCFILPMLVFGIFYGGDLIEGSIFQFLIKMIIFPLVIQVLIVRFMNNIYQCKSIGWICKYKMRILCYSLFIMIAISAMIYRYFHVLWIAPCVCLYLHSVYANRKGVRWIYFITNIFVIKITKIFVIK